MCIQALQQLHALLNASDNREVAFNTTRNYSLPQYQRDVAQCVANLKAQPYHTYLLYTDNSYEFAVNWLALLLLNKDIVLSANNKRDWLSSIQDSYQAIITDAPYSGVIASNHYAVNSEIPAEPLRLPEELTTTIQFYTSGSSSKPKAITKTAQQLFIEVDTLESLFQTKLGSCQFLASVSHHHIYGLIFRLLWPLLYRRAFYTDIILYPEQLIELSRQRPDSCLISSPAFLSRQDQELPSLSLRQCFSSGSLLSKSAADGAKRQLGRYPIEVFGSTETGGIGYRTQESNNASWTLFPGASLRFDQEQRAIFNSPHLVEPQPLDDKVQLVSQREFKLQGRIDRVVKIEEKRVSLDAIEAALNDSDWVDQAKVVVLQQQRVCLGAVIQLSTKGQGYLQANSRLQLNQQLKALLRQKFEAVAIPRKWRYPEQLPYNSQGKLPVASLRELF
ncbi:AMP-binding protein [Kangiella shandongensis]|uniref:AMP-binding protein n=1 Tax=Kangiella shandongensis TaxID=2763258 RepID=UPI001CBA8682|nr:AMP-binding protein [Kangiella shandongensis]